jgi:hypothetical protein
MVLFISNANQAQEAALKEDQTKTLGELRAAESELLKITQTLPSQKYGWRLSQNR